MSEPTPSPERTHDIVSQRRAPERHFDTPTWVSPSADQPEVPRQAGPEHDRILKQAAPVGQRPDILEQAHWVGARTARRTFGALLLVALAATAGTGYLFWNTRSEANLTALVVCGLVAVALWAGMASTRPMAVDLQGSTLTVHHHNTEDVFDLANPFQVTRLRGTVGSPAWSLALERQDGTEVVVGSRTVPPAQLHPVVLHYRARTEVERVARIRSFGR